MKNNKKPEDIKVLKSEINRSKLLTGYLKKNCFYKKSFRNTLDYC